MEKLTPVLIAVGVCFGFILIIFVLIVRKYVQLVRTEESFPGYNARNNKSTSSSHPFISSFFPFFDVTNVNPQMHTQRARTWNLKKTKSQKPLHREQRGRFNSMPNLNRITNDKFPLTTDDNKSVLSDHEDDKCDETETLVITSETLDEGEERVKSGSVLLHDRVRSLSGKSISTITTQRNASFSKEQENPLKVLLYCRTNGMIEFTTHYFFPESLLELHIWRVHGFTTKEQTLDLNVHVRAFLEPGKLQKTDTGSQIGHTPFFNEKIQFEGIHETDLKKYRLVLKAYNKEKRKAKELLGIVNMDLTWINYFDDSTEVHHSPLFDF